MFGKKYGERGSTLYGLIREGFIEYLDIPAPTATVKDYKILHSLIEEQGADEAEELVYYTISNWNHVKSKLKVNGFPNVGLIWGFRFSILDLMNNDRDSHGKFHLPEESPRFSKFDKRIVRS